MKERASTVPPPQIPLAFVATALLWLGGLLLWNLFGSPAPLAALHALILGFFLTTAMGLIYQFVPVVAMLPLQLQRLCYVHLAFATLGTALLVMGFARGDLSAVRDGGAIFLVGVLLQIVIVATTLRGKRPPAPAAVAALSLLWLLATLSAGLWTAQRFIEGTAIAGAAFSHALLGLAGFFGTLIVGVTLRLLRMFERFDLEPRAPYLAGATSLAALLSLLAVVFAPALAFVPLEVVAAAFFFALFGVLRERNPAYQRETLYYALASGLGALAAPVALAYGDGRLAILLALWVFVGCAVVGYLQRIVPFLWWIARSRSEGARNIPTLGEMNHSALGSAILTLWLLGGALLVIGAQRPAAALALLAWMGLLAQLARPFVLQKRTAET
uniref:NnrS family protein n=1 Tax=mine drainage metagenome TaxID=410659 RepID=E6Q314_9ZZZZ